MKVNLVYIISDTDKALAFEWIAKRLDKEMINLHFILLNPGNSFLEDNLRTIGLPVYHIKLNSRKDYPLVLLKLLILLLKLKPNIIHTHLRNADFLGQIAGMILGIRKRIHTRHSGTGNHMYHPHAVKYDKLINALATNIVAISENVKTVLIEKDNAKSKKITLIHHGFELEKFTCRNEEKIKQLKIKYNASNKYPIVGVISRYVLLKGIHYIIRAFSKLLDKYPGAHLILANARGSAKGFISNELKQLPADSYTEIAFENDLFTLYQLFDLFVHVPINHEVEAFGQPYVEALASGIPSVFTLSGVAREFIINKENALVVYFESAEQIYESLCELIEDKELCKKLIEKGKMHVEKFNIADYIEKLLQLYTI